MSTFTCMFKKLRGYILTCMVIYPFRYYLCSLSNIIFRTISFRTGTMANNIVVMFKICFIYHLKASAKFNPWEGCFFLMLVSNKVFILFLMDFMTNSCFLPWFGTSKKCYFSSLTFLSSTTSFKFKFMLVKCNFCSFCSSKKKKKNKERMKL